MCACGLRLSCNGYEHKPLLPTQWRALLAPAGETVGLDLNLEGCPCISV